LILVFVIRYLYDHHYVVWQVIRELSLPTMLLVFLSISIGKLLLVINMQYSLNCIGKNISYAKSFHYYNITQLGKYMPGNFWHFVGRYGYYRAERLSFSEIHKALILEMLFISLGCLLVSAVFFSLNPSFYSYLASLNVLDTRFIFIPVIVLCLTTVFLLIKRKVFKKVARHLLSNWRLNIKILIVQFAIWLFLGASFYLLLRGHTIHHGLFPNIISLYSIAYLLGFLFVLAPAGIGVREFVLISGLGFIDMPMDIKLSLVGFHRVFYMAAEVILAAIAFAIFMYFEDRHPSG